MIVLKYFVSIVLFIYNLKSSSRKIAPVLTQNRLTTPGICTELAWTLVGTDFTFIICTTVNVKNTSAFLIMTDAIEELGVTPLIKILDSYGQWPLTVSNWTEDRFDWRKLTASIRNTFGLSFLFEVSNFVDFNNTEFSTIYVSRKNIQHLADHNLIILSVRSAIVRIAKFCTARQQFDQWPNSSLFYVYLRSGSRNPRCHWW